MLFHYDLLQVSLKQEARLLIMYVPGLDREVKMHGRKWGGLFNHWWI